MLGAHSKEIYNHDQIITSDSSMQREVLTKIDCFDILTEKYFKNVIYFYEAAKIERLLQSKILFIIDRKTKEREILKESNY